MRGHVFLDDGYRPVMPAATWDGLFELVLTSVLCDTSSEFLYFV